MNSFHLFPKFEFLLCTTLYKKYFLYVLFTVLRFSFFFFCFFWLQNLIVRIKQRLLVKQIHINSFEVCRKLLNKGDK